MNLALVLVFIGLCFYLLKFTDKNPKLLSVNTGILVSLVLLFILNKILKLMPLGSINPIFSFIGLSYAILKLGHVLVDSRNGMIKEYNLLGFTNYMLFFPAFISGPIIRYQDFHKEVSDYKTFSEISDQFIYGTKRVILGLFKLIVISKFVMPLTFFSLNKNFLLNSNLFELIFFSNMSLIHLYLNFSGYTDLAIGISSWMGLKIPENFNYPFLSRNLQELWKHWHITFSEWLRTYIFFPLNKFLVTHKFFSGNITLISAATLSATFFIMGIFNGLAINFIIHGLLLAFGVAVGFFWTNYLKKKKLAVKYNNILSIKYFSIFLTFQYFSFCVLFFDANTPERFSLLLQIIKSYV